MSDSEQDLIQLISKVKQTGYEKGWEDAVGKMQKALNAFFDEFSASAAAIGPRDDDDADEGMKRAAGGSK